MPDSAFYIPKSTGSTEGIRTIGKACDHKWDLHPQVGSIGESMDELNRKNIVLVPALSCHGDDRSSGISDSSTGADVGVHSQDHPTTGNHKTG